MTADDARKRQAEQGASGEDEALARVIGGIDDDEWADLPGFAQNQNRRAARAVLASDWLAAHDAAVAAAAKREGAAAIVAAVEAELADEESRLAEHMASDEGLLHNWLGGIRVAGRAARAAASALDDPQHREGEVVSARETCPIHGVSR